jgi:hypothetical protein
VRRAREIGQVLLLGAAFGVLVAVVKGQDAGARDALGNMSAPWVLVPFLAGTRCTKLWQGALVGVAATLAAFVGFYAAEAAILDLGPHPWYVDLRLTLGSGHLYEKWGVPTGVLYGVLGAMWSGRRLALAPIVVCLAFVAEPAIVWLATRAGVWGGGGLLDYRWLWVSELLVGVAGILFVVIVADRRQPRAATR